MTSSAAIFFQKSKSKQDEFRLIELVTVREKIVKSLEVVVRDVKEGRKAKDDSAIILQTLKLMTDVRNATIKLLLAISKWQEAFTKPIRPQLMDCDYIVEKVIKHIDFLNSSSIRKLFNFQILRGNALILPYPKSDLSHTIKTGGIITSIENPSIGVSSQEIAVAIKDFTTLNEEEVIQCYQFLINCIPADIYESKLAPLERWLIHPWIPDITVLTIPYNGVMNTSEMKNILAESILNIDKIGLSNDPMNRTDSQRKLRSFSYESESVEQVLSTENPAQLISLKIAEGFNAKDQIEIDTTGDGNSNAKGNEAPLSNSSHKTNTKHQKASNTKSNTSNNDTSPSPLSTKPNSNRARFEKFKSPATMKKLRRSNPNNHSISQIHSTTDAIKLTEHEEEQDTEDEIEVSLEHLEELSKIEEIICNLTALTRSASPSHTLQASATSSERINKSQRLAFLIDTTPTAITKSDPTSTKSTTESLKPQTQVISTTTASIISATEAVASSKRTSASLPPMKKSTSRHSRFSIATNQPYRSSTSSVSVASGQGSTSAHYTDMENRSDAFSEVEEDGFSVNTDSRAGGVMETKKKQQTLKAQTPGASLKISSAMLRSLILQWYGVSLDIILDRRQRTTS